MVSISGVNTQALSPRMVAMGRTSGKSKGKLMSYLLPAALLFTVGGIAYTFAWDKQRREAGPCVDCARQKEMMEEVYFTKKPAMQKGYRL